MKTVQMKTVQWRQLRRSSVLIIKCKHVSHFVAIDDFEQQTFAGFILKIQARLKAKSSISCVKL